MSEIAVGAGAYANLWRNRAFIRLWIAQVLSHSGSAITGVALPLTAVLLLNATPAQMGLLRIARDLPNLLFGLFAGVWVDRKRRRPILVGADLGRALLLGSIPVAALLGHLTFVHLVLVVFAAATLTVFFTIASVSILPSLVKRDQLVEANSKLATSDSILGIAGPSVAGGLVQLLGAPIAIVADAASYVLSALFLSDITEPEPSSQRAPGLMVIWREISEGVHELVRTPLLRALTTSASVGSFGGGVQGTVLMLFFVRGLDLSPAVIGIVLTFGSAGSLVGAVLAGRTAHIIGSGRAAILGNCLWAIGSLVMPLAGFLAGPNLLYLGAGQVLIGTGATLYSVNQMSLRQHITPVGLFGRATAARRFLIFGTAAGGAALGGFLGGTIGLRATLAVGALCFGLGALLVYFSPVRHVHDLSTATESRR